MTGVLIGAVLFVAAILLVLVWVRLVSAGVLANAMQAEDAKYLKRSVKSGSLDVHPSQPALVLSYALEAHLLRPTGDPLHRDRKELQKVIKLSGLNQRSDCAALAKEVVDKCDLIHPSKLSEVEHLIQFLKDRDQSHSSPLGIKSARLGGKLEKKSNMGPAEGSSASINAVDQYVELLYEDIQDKIKGSALILQLARNPDNLIELSKNEALLSALSRVLREEWKKSIELSTNIVFTFFSFSTYNEFHPFILQYKIGSLCMDVIDFELKRFDQWKESLEGKSKPTVSVIKTELPKSKIPEPKRRPKSGTWAVTDINSGSRDSRSLNKSYHEELCNVVDSPKSDEEQLKRKLKALTKRQEQLLRVAFYLLLNIADNIKVEEKMHKKNIVGLLVGALQRHSNVDLSILIVSFLLKLSVYKENKDEMVNMGFIEKLPELLDASSRNPDLVNVTLRLLFNLTFDTKLRNRMVKIGLLPKLISFISDDKHTSIVTKALYHLSMDDRVKAMFAHTDCATLVIDMVLLSKEGTQRTELAALAVNLSLQPRCAALMASSGRLAALASRAFRATDLLLIKLIRNLSQHTENKHLFIDFVGDIANVITTPKWGDEAFVVECLGILGNILQPDLDILALVKQYNFMSFLTNILSTDSSASEEIVLGAVVVTGSIAGEEAAAAALCASEIPILLVELLRARQEDDDLVLQIVFAFRQLLRHPSSAAYLINNTEAPAYLIDLIQDKNLEIRKLCESCLDIITQTNSEWAVRIKVERFRCHNSQWLSVVEELSGDGETGDLSDPDLPPYLSTEYLSNNNIFNTGSQMSLSATDESDLQGDGESRETPVRPQSRFGKDVEDVDFGLMENSSLIMKSCNSMDCDSLSAIEYPLQD